MAYNEKIADHVRELIAQHTGNAEEKQMFGSLCFLVEDKICIGVKKDSLMVRIDPDVYAVEIEKHGRKPMVHFGKVVKPYLFIDLDEVHSANDLAYWVKLCLDYNPLAPLSQAKQKAKKKQ